MSCLVQQFGFEDRNDLEKVDVDSLRELDRLDDRHDRSHDEKVTHAGVWPKRLSRGNRMAVVQDYLVASGIQHRLVLQLRATAGGRILYGIICLL